MRENAVMQTDKQFSPFELMGRVYEAAKLKGFDRERDGLSRMARLLEESVQTVKNWESRGPSSSGLLKIQRVLGISATWVLHGTGPMLTDGTGQGQSSSGVGEVIAPWPFTDIEFSRWAALPERAKGRLEAKFEALIEQAEAAEPKDSAKSGSRVILDSRRASVIRHGEAPSQELYDLGLTPSSQEIDERRWREKNEQSPPEPDKANRSAA